MPTKKMEISDTEISFVLSKRSWNFIKQYLSDAKVILDIGCGNGTLLYNLKKESDGIIVGLDSSKKRVKRAKKLVPSSEIICADALKSPLLSNVVNIITSTMFIEHVDDSAFIKEAKASSYGWGGFLFCLRLLKKEALCGFMRILRGNGSLILVI